MMTKRFIQMAALFVLPCLPGTVLAVNQHALNVTCTDGGSVQIMANYGGVAKSWAGPVSIVLDEGTQVQLLATADLGWHFAYWVGTVGYNDAAISLTMDKDWSLEAVFNQAQSTLAVTCGKGGTIVRPGLGSFAYTQGAVVIIQAEPNDAYRFSTWSGSAVDAGKVAEPTSASTFVTMDADYTLQANFTAIGHTVSVSAGPGGSVTIPGVGDFGYLDGAVIVITARADSGYHFVNWTGSAVDALKVAAPTSATTTLTVDDNYTLKANFAGNQHTLTVTWTSGGSVQTASTSNGARTTWTSQGSFLVDDGATVQMIATPDSGWHFTHWSGASESGTTLTFTLTGDRSIEAYFAQDSRTLVVTAGEGGTVTRPGVGSFVYERGTPVAVEAVANSGYRFAKWTGSLVDANDVTNPLLSQTTVIVDANGTLQANFELLAQDLNEGWQNASVGSFTPSKYSFIGGDEGFWLLSDGFMASSACGPTPQRAAVLTVEDDHALMLISVNSGSTCSDRVSVLLGATNSPAPWLGVPIATNTIISFDEAGKLCSPGLHSTTKGSLTLPAYDNVSVILTDNNGNILTYVLQRYAGATVNLGSASLGNTYGEVFLDPTAIKYQRNVFNDFLSISAFQPAGARITSIEFRVDAHGSAIIDNITAGAGTIIQKVPVYRFWSPRTGDHFYTASETEREKVSNAHAGDWVPEGIAYFALANGSDPNTVPVYRFWSPVANSHFYTASESEKNKLIEKFSNLWTFEGVYFYAYAADRRPADTVPVYRFWSQVLGDHFYTTSEPEKDKVISMNPAIWVREGIAWYAYKPWPFTAALDAQSCSK